MYEPDWNNSEQANGPLDENTIRTDLHISTLWPSGATPFEHVTTGYLMLADIIQIYNMYDVTGIASIISGSRIMNLYLTCNPNESDVIIEQFEHVTERNLWRSYEMTTQDSTYSTSNAWNTTLTPISEEDGSSIVTTELLPSTPDSGLGSSETL